MRPSSATAAGVTSATSGTVAVDVDAHPVAEQVDAVDRPRQTLRGLPSGRWTVQGDRVRMHRDVHVAVRRRRRRRRSRRSSSVDRRSPSARPRSRLTPTSSATYRERGRAATSAIGPTCATLPCSRTTRRSASATASSGSWVTRIARAGERREMRRADRAAARCGCRCRARRAARRAAAAAARCQRPRQRDALRLAARQLARASAARTSASPTRREPFVGARRARRPSACRGCAARTRRSRAR